MSASLSLEAFAFTYGDAGVPAIQGVSVTLEAPGAIAILGPQGCGKTTLLRAIAGTLTGIYHGRVTGHVALRMNGTPLGPPPWTEHVAAFFDSEVQITLAAETVREEIALPSLARRVTEADASARADAAAAELGIAHLLDRNVTDLSGGEEKLTGLAATLGCPSAVYILDEPFEQLDDRHLILVLRAIRRRARAGSLVIIATNWADIALNVATRALVSSRGAWSVPSTPSYGLLLARASELDGSPVLSELAASAGPDTLESVRTYRDAAVCLASHRPPS